jgi:hypothetical protein
MKTFSQWGDTTITSGAIPTKTSDHRWGEAPLQAVGKSPTTFYISGTLSLAHRRPQSVQHHLRLVLERAPRQLPAASASRPSPASPPSTSSSATGSKPPWD